MWNFSQSLSCFYSKHFESFMDIAGSPTRLDREGEQKDTECHATSLLRCHFIMHTESFKDHQSHKDLFSVYHQ